MKRVGDKIYQSRAWRDRLRPAYYESKYGLCEQCGAPGDIVDHIEPITADNVDDPDVTYNWDNLMLLCQSCHNTKTFRKHKPVREGLGFDEFGNLIQVRGER